MNSHKKIPIKTEEEEITLPQKTAVEIVKYLFKQFPDSLIQRIHLLKDILEIEFKALSFSKAPPNELEVQGQTLIANIHNDLQKIWKEDKKYRKEDKNV